MSSANKILFMILLLSSLGCLGQSTTAVDGTSLTTIHLSNFHIRPNTIEVKKGSKVKLTVMVDEGEHDLIIEGYDLRVPIEKKGGVNVLEFTAGRAGEFEMWCEVRNHRERGMTGRLIVS